jgi:hypothetical protein
MVLGHCSGRGARSKKVGKRFADPYRRRVKWWKLLNVAYSRREGRHELLSGDRSAILTTAISTHVALK